MRQDRLDRIAEDMLLYVKEKERNEEELFAFLSQKGLRPEEIDLLLHSFRKLSTFAISQDEDPAPLLKCLVKMHRAHRHRKKLRGPIDR